MRTTRHTATQAPIRITFWREGDKGEKCQIVLQWVWERVNENQIQTVRGKQRERETSFG